jgi:molecular chaperone HscC
MIVGIDLGTTNSLVSIFRNGTTELIPNALGHFLTPSCVGLGDDGAILVGLAARERSDSHPASTASAFKRTMGTQQQVRLGERTYRPEELSALVLKSLKADAEAFLGEPVTEAVITVPAYFNEAQRRATKTAGELAGFKVERLLNEPTAAGLAYGLQERDEDTTFLVFDLGGGTFDVSVLEYFQGVVQVHASAGDTHLGGEDFVKVLLDWFAQDAPGLSATARAQLAHDKVNWRIAEQAKRDLSEREATSMTIMHDGLACTLDLTRAAFEQRCEGLLQRLRAPIERALMDARLDAGTLSEVVLVGGASRMPMVRQLVTRLFARLPLRTINPDETIARGAAIQAALKARDAALDDVVLTDVMPYSMGIIVQEQINGIWYRDVFSPVIERNSPVPVSRLKQYTATGGAQSAVDIDIRQGESPVGSENLQLGTMSIQVPRSSPGDTGLNVRFSYDANGLLEVEAQLPATGEAVRTVIQRSSTEMTAEQVAASLAALAVLKIHPRAKQENVYVIERAKRLYGALLGAERESIGHHLRQFEDTLDRQDERAIRQHARQMLQFLDSLDRGFTL